MRVLFVISSFNTGGAQRALSNIVTHLPGEWEIDILLNSADNITYPYAGRLIDLGLKEPSDRSSFSYQLKALLKRFPALRKLKKTGSYNACVSFLDSANFANIITGSKYCRTVVSSRIIMSRVKSFKQSCINLMIRMFYSRADCVIAVSEGIKDDLTRNLGVKSNVTTIYNGYSVTDILKRAGERTANNGVFTFITAGRCDHQKGQWHLLRAFAMFSGKHENSRLIILGDGPYIEYLRQLVVDFGLEGKVLLKGFVSNPYAELVSADAYVFPSLFEGFPNAMAEAMICGLPVIASDFRSGAREILAPGTDISFEQTSGVELAEFGIITPVCSGRRFSASDPLEPQEKFLLEAMELLCSDEALRARYREAAARRAQDFSIEKCVEQWCRVIVC